MLTRQLHPALAHNACTIPIYCIANSVQPCTENTVFTCADQQSIATFTRFHASGSLLTTPTSAAPPAKSKKLRIETEADFVGGGAVFLGALLMKTRTVTKSGADATGSYYAPPAHLENRLDQSFWLSGANWPAECSLPVLKQLPSQ